MQGYNNSKMLTDNCTLGKRDLHYACLSCNKERLKEFKESQLRTGGGREFHKSIVWEKKENW